eukprot:jgi/Botrbrau1/9200/Bobra.0236s0027.1
MHGGQDGYQGGAGSGGRDGSGGGGDRGREETPQQPNFMQGFQPPPQSEAGDAAAAERALALFQSFMAERASLPQAQRGPLDAAASALLAPPSWGAFPQTSEPSSRPAGSVLEPSRQSLHAEGQGGIGALQPVQPTPSPGRPAEEIRGAAASPLSPPSLGPPGGPNAPPTALSSPNFQSPARRSAFSPAAPSEPVQPLSAERVRPEVSKQEPIAGTPGPVGPQFRPPPPSLPTPSTEEARPRQPDWQPGLKCVQDLLGILTRARDIPWQNNYARTQMMEFESAMHVMDFVLQNFNVEALAHATPATPGSQPGPPPGSGIFTGQRGGQFPGEFPLPGGQSGLGLTLGGPLGTRTAPYNAADLLAKLMGSQLNPPQAPAPPPPPVPPTLPSAQAILNELLANLGVPQAAPGPVAPSWGHPNPLATPVPMAQEPIAAVIQALFGSQPPQQQQQQQQQQQPQRPQQPPLPQPVPQMSTEQWSDPSYSGGTSGTRAPLMQLTETPGPYGPTWPTQASQRVGQRQSQASPSQGPPDDIQDLVSMLTQSFAAAGHPAGLGGNTQGLQFPPASGLAVNQPQQGVDAQIVLPPPSPRYNPLGVGSIDFFFLFFPPPFFFFFSFFFFFFFFWLACSADPGPAPQPFKRRGEDAFPSLPRPGAF